MKNQMENYMLRMEINRIIMEFKLSSTVLQKISFPKLIES